MFCVRSKLSYDVNYWVTCDNVISSRVSDLGKILLKSNLPEWDLRCGNLVVSATEKCSVIRQIALVHRSEFADTILSVHPSDVLDMPVDPNEPTYCLCHQVSYGEMIGCDNPDVST